MTESTEQTKTTPTLQLNNNIKLKQTDLETIRKLYLEDKLSMTKIAKLYNTSTTAIAYFLKKNNIKIFDRKTKLNDRKNQSLKTVKDYLNKYGFSGYKKICFETGLSEVTVRNRLRELSPSDIKILPKQ